MKVMIQIETWETTMHTVDDKDQDQLPVQGPEQELGP